MIIGLDANIICYALDEEYSEHEKLKDLFLNLSSGNKVALNPTTLHEAYHTLVFGQKWIPEDARQTLKLLLAHPYVVFFNQTKKNCEIALSLSVRHRLGGRDALIIANFLANEVPVFYTHDQELLKLGKVIWKTSQIVSKDPLNNVAQQKKPGRMLNKLTTHRLRIKAQPQKATQRMNCTSETLLFLKRCLD